MNPHLQLTLSHFVLLAFPAETFIVGRLRMCPYIERLPVRLLANAFGHEMDAQLCSGGKNLCMKKCIGMLHIIFNFVPSVTFAFIHFFAFGTR